MYLFAEYTGEVLKNEEAEKREDYYLFETQVVCSPYHFILVFDSIQTLYLEVKDTKRIKSNISRCWK